MPIRQQQTRTDIPAKNYAKSMRKIFGRLKHFLNLKTKSGKE